MGVGVRVDVAVAVLVGVAVGREDAEVMARKLFTVDTEAVKHEAQTETQHLLYSPLPEQWEKAVAAIQALLSRVALVKRIGETERSRSGANTHRDHPALPGQRC